MRNCTLLLLLASLFSTWTSTAQNGRKLRWQQSNQSSVTYKIGNTNNSNSFLNVNNWRLVNANGTVSATTATPANGDTLQVYNATLSLEANFDMTALQNIVLDFGNPRPGLSSSFIVRRDMTWLLHSSAKINVRSGDLESEMDNSGVINTGIKIGGVDKMLSVNYATVIVHGPSSATSATPPTVTYMQEGFIVGVLPMVLVSFDAVKQGNGVQLSWRTQQEFNTKQFLVEKSNDGKSFYSIADLKASGTSTTPRSYSFVDNIALSGVAYYRIRVVSADDYTGFTPVKAVRTAQAAASRLGLYPNPARGYTNIVMNNPESLSFKVNVYNRSGQLVAQRNQAAGSNTFALDVNQLPDGDYTVEVRMGDGSRQTSKLLIQR
ncbi:MAG: hypothetical protein RL732_561 [Bacteroidota bacterium]